MAYRKILVPLDGSQGSWRAFRRALLLAGEAVSEIAALSVEEHLPRYAATVGEVEQELEAGSEYFTRLHDQAKSLAAERGLGLTAETVVGHAARAIVDYARENDFDLIVIGHVGHSGIWGTLLGSTTDRVVDHAHCDVLVVR
ncbi:MAG TPA: universal stress protein [Chloroflexota bacterium]